MHKVYKAAYAKNPRYYAVFSYGGETYIRTSEKPPQEIIGDFEAEVRAFEEWVKGLDKGWKPSDFGFYGDMSRRPVCEGAGTICTQRSSYYWIIKYGCVEGMEPNPHLAKNMMFYIGYWGSDNQFIADGKRI